MLKSERTLLLFVPEIVGRWVVAGYDPDRKEPILDLGTDCFTVSQVRRAAYEDESRSDEPFEDWELDGINKAVEHLRKMAEGERS